MNKKMCYILLGTVFLLSCSSKGDATHLKSATKQQRTSKLAADSPSAKKEVEAAKVRQAARAKIEEERIARQTTLTISPSVYDFGKIPKRKPVSTIFTIKNTGKKPLIIRDASASCGCTVPVKPEKPILPGGEGKLKVIFTSEPDQVGQQVHKIVSIVGNFPGEVKKVAIMGQLEP